MVKRADANDIEVEDLDIYDMAWILSIHPKSLNKSQQAWHISEKELYVPVVGVRRYGSYISSVIARWFMKWPKMQVEWTRGQLVAIVAKIAFGSDSSTALGSLVTIQILEGKMDFLTPKIQRLQGHAEEMSVTPFWSIARLKVVGDGSIPCNSLSDFICRMIGELKRKQNAQTNEDEDWEMTPWSLAIAEQSMETGCEGMQHFPPEVKDELGFGPQNAHKWWLDGYKEWVSDAWSLAITYQKDGAPLGRWVSPSANGVFRKEVGIG